jgi:hypothetical protein
MNPDIFCKQTTIPVPNIDYKRVWNIDSTNSADTIPRWLTYTNTSAIWNDNTKERLVDVGMTPGLIRIFRWKPNGVFPWHIDGTTTIPTNFSINWVLEGEGIIQWNSKLEFPRPITALGSANAYASKIGGKDDKFEFQAKGHGCIVNTIIPHRILNNSNTHRITVSILFGNKFSYSEAVEKLKSCGFVE